MSSLLLVFNRVYRLEIQSVGISTGYLKYSPSNLLSGERNFVFSTALLASANNATDSAII